MGVFKNNGNWWMDYRVKGRRRRKKIDPSKRVAETVVSDIQVKIAKGEYLDIQEHKRVLFRDFAQEYLQYS